MRNSSALEEGMQELYRCPYPKLCDRMNPIVLRIDLPTGEHLARIKVENGEIKGATTVDYPSKLKYSLTWYPKLDAYKVMIIGLGYLGNGQLFSYKEVAVDTGKQAIESLGFVAEFIEGEDS